MPNDCPSLMPDRHLTIICCLVAMALSASASWGDVVWLKPDASSQTPTRRTGTILDYRGTGLQLRSLAGREATIAANKVARIEYKKHKRHQLGDAAFASGDYAAADEHYAAALRGTNRSDRQQTEKRGWVRAELTAASLRCKVALGDEGAAGRLFVTLVRHDPDSIHLGLIPLAWTSASTAKETSVRAWTRGVDAPAVRLLAASHLLRSPRRANALADLEALAKGDNPDIARLASAQLWLTKVPTATEKDLARWQKTIEQMPDDLRAGPYYVLGRGYAARKQYQRAALMQMRVAILFPHRGDLTAESLLSAGSSLAALKQNDEAIRVLREVVADYPKAYAATEATERLDRLGAEP